MNRQQVFQTLLAALAGRVKDPYGVVRLLQLRLGNVLLSKIQQAFVTKSRGGVGPDGIKWKPLSPYTIARRRQSAEDKKALTLKSRGAALSASDRKALEKEIRERTSRMVVSYGMDRKQAAGLARAAAEAKFRKTGSVKSKESILASRPVDILRDTNKLMRSFSPGVEEKPSGAAGQILETPDGEIVVGTKEKPWHHRGGGWLPSRPYWPLNQEIPADWANALELAMQRGLMVMVDMITRGQLQ